MRKMAPILAIPSRFKAKNRRVQSLGRTNRIEVFAEERDLSVSGAQEHYVILVIDTARRLDESLRLDFGDRPVRIGEGIHLEVEEAEILDRTEEPTYVTYRLRAPY